MHRLGTIAIVTSVLLGAVGCETPPGGDGARTWRDVKIGDLGPKSPDAPRRARFLGTIHFDVYVWDLPAENVGKLDDLWQALSAKPIRTNSYTAFSGNGFRVRYGRLRIWEKVRALLAEAGGQTAGTTSLVLSDETPTDLPIADVSQTRRISFVGTDLSQQVANVNPGVLALRLRAEPVPGARGVRKIIAYPVHTLGVSIGIPELDATARQTEFYFGAAAFASQMSPGDLVVLAPDRYSGEQQRLGGLFFNRAVGAVFIDPAGKRPPERKPTVRVFALLCTRMSD